MSLHSLQWLCWSSVESWMSQTQVLMAFVLALCLLDYYWILHCDCFHRLNRWWLFVDCRWAERLGSSRQLRLKVSYCWHILGYKSIGVTASTFCCCVKASQHSWFSVYGIVEKPSHFAAGQNVLKENVVDITQLVYAQNVQSSFWLTIWRFFEINWRIFNNSIECHILGHWTTII